MTLATVLFLGTVIAALAVHTMWSEKRERAIAYGLPPPKFKLPNWKWLLPLTLVVGCSYLCSRALETRTYDVTSDFDKEVRTTWCTTEDHFVVRFPGTGLLYVEAAGSSSDVPNSVADYEAHPNDWHKLPAYASMFSTPYVHPGEIHAGIPKGTKFRVVKVTKEVDFENGPSIHPQVIFAGSARRFGAVEGVLMNGSHGEHFRFEYAVPCR